MNQYYQMMTIITINMKASRKRNNAIIVDLNSGLLKTTPIQKTKRPALIVNEQGRMIAYVFILCKTNSNVVKL